MRTLRISASIFTAGIAAYVLLTTPVAAHAWGRIGHDLSARAAAHVLAKTKERPFFKSHAFDLGYYCNVPDLVWKKTSYEVEWTNHFQDLEIFERELKKAVEDGKLSPKEDVYELDRGVFDNRFPQIPKTAGRAYWRIRELEKRLGATADLLKQKDILLPERHRLQAEWLLVAGVMGHYISDLAQPLHVTENYDGQMTEQKGVHAHFEDTLVDELWPSIEMQVLKEAEKIYDKEKNIWAGKSVLSLVKELAISSGKEVNELLNRDKKISRDDIKKSTEANRAMIVRRLAAGSAVMAEIWRRHANWQPNSEKFYAFTAEPGFIEPPKPVATPTPTPKPGKK